METTTYTDGHACVDCIMLIANGDTSGNSRCETEEGEAAYLADVARYSEGGEWVNNCDETCEGGFSWSPCDVCRSPLGGDRHPVAWFPSGQ